MDTSIRQHTRQLASELLDDVELSRTTVSLMVLKASRLARLVGDVQAEEWLAFETAGIPNSPAGRRHMTHTQRWTDGDTSKGFWSPVTDLEQMVFSFQRQLDASRIDAYSGDGIIVASREHRQAVASITSRITALTAVVNRVQSMIHGFARRTFYELEFATRQQTLFESARGSIDGLLAPTVGQALEKIDSIYRRLDEGDAEGVSQAMNTCRRLIDSFADAVYPAEPGKSVDVDGDSLDVGPGRTKNRIVAFNGQHVQSKDRRNRLRRSLMDIYSRVSSGVHADISIDEARHLFLSTYVLLGEILAARSTEGGPAGQDS